MKRICFVLAMAVGGCDGDHDPAAEAESAGASDPRNAFYVHEEPISAEVLAASRTYAIPNNVVIEGWYRTREEYFGEDWSAAKASVATDENGGRRSRLTVKFDRIGPIEFFADASSLREQVKSVPPVEDIQAWTKPAGIGLVVAIKPDAHMMLCFQNTPGNEYGLPAGERKEGWLRYHAIASSTADPEHATFAPAVPGTVQVEFTQFADESVYATRATVGLCSSSGAAQETKLLVTVCHDKTMLIWSGLPPFP